MNHIKIICLILCCILLLSFAACIPNGMTLPDSTIEPTVNIPKPTINPTTEQTFEPMLNPYETVLLEARKLFLTAKYDEAIDKCNEAISLDNQRIESFLLLADIWLVMYDRNMVLEALKQEIMDRGGTNVQENELLVGKYWETYCDVAVDAVKPIKDNEFSKLESLAYICSSNEPFLFIEEIYDNYLVPLGVMYVGNGYAAVYKDTRRYQDLAYKEYNDYVFYDGQYTYPSRVKAIQEKHIKRIVKQLFGIDISSPEPNTYLAGGVNYADGMYYFEYGDYISYRRIVSSYYYLDDDTYIVAFDSDDSGLDGPDEDKNGIIPQIEYFVVRRANTPLGFTVISKLKSRFKDDLFNMLTMPEGFVPVEQSKQ